jgi:hypothetical protein
MQGQPRTKVRGWPSDHLCRYTHCSRTFWYVTQHDSVRADLCVVAYGDRTEDFRARTDIDVPTDARRSWAITQSDRDLLEYQAIWSNNSVGMNDDSIRMWHAKPASNPTI